MSQDQLETGELAAGEQEEVVDLDLEVEVTSPSTCERHVTVTISRSDIDRYLDKSYSELMPTANVPGFRTGRAPRKIVESRFKDEVVQQIKGSLLMDSLAQISEQQQFTAISEPELDLEAIEVPSEGPMTFEFNIEVRPEFEMPEWKGLEIDRPTREFSDSDIEEQLEPLLDRHGRLIPHDGEAAEGDYLSVNIRSSKDGETLATIEEALVRIRSQLSFADGELTGFHTLMEGAKPGDKKTAQLTTTTVGDQKQVELEFEVLDIKRLELPELNAELLQSLGRFETVEELHDAVRNDLERQLEYKQQQEVRRQITAILTKSADWELPPALLERQSSRELERAVMELKRSGFSEAEIRVRSNQLRQNSADSTATALKEHFILERIAEDESIDADPADFEREVFLMAMQSGENPRKIRAQLEKRGLMDVLRNQIIERKVLELVQEHAKFNDQPYETEKVTTEAVDFSVGGGGSHAIPDAVEGTSSEQSDSEDA